MIAARLRRRRRLFALLRFCGALLDGLGILQCRLGLLGAVLDAPSATSGFRFLSRFSAVETLAGSGRASR